MGPEAAGRLGVWMPLTRASVENGCMYVLPKDQDVQLPKLRAGVPQQEAFDSASAQGVRAVPARPGELLVLDGEVLHWSGAGNAEAATEARVAVAFEFVRRQTEGGSGDGMGGRGSSGEVLLAAGGAVPSWGERLRTIQMQVRKKRVVAPHSCGGTVLTTVAALAWLLFVPRSLMHTATC